MKTIQTIRYMGNKVNLLHEIIPVIEENYKLGSCICDLMAGTNTVSYAIKDNYKLITNDIQIYSKIISDAIICNKETINLNNFGSYFIDLYNTNIRNLEFSFFIDNYTDKYFSFEQCRQIDSIRFAIEKSDVNRSAALTALMYSMNLAQSTPGHFAQFLPSTHPRVKPLRRIDILDNFLIKLEELSKIPVAKYENKSFCTDYKELIKNDIIKEVDVFYIDTPYTGEQYSRFYHILDTVVKYDNPSISFKAGYRNDRYKSNFSYKTKAYQEFDYMIKEIYNLKKDIILSYSNKGLISVSELVKIFKKYYSYVTVKEVEYNHSTQGKGTVDVKEIIIYSRY